MANEVLEGSATEGASEPVSSGPPAGSPAPGSDLVATPAAILRPLDVREVKQAMDEYQQGLHAILDESDWQNTGDGKFVKKSGWRKVATWFGLSVSVVRERVERDEQGDPLRASVVARAIAANGRYMDGDGHCSSSESRFKSNRGRQKLENDLIGTATTRAKNRAIADLVGMGAVSAEEVEGTLHKPAGPEFGEAASAELETKLAAALHTLVGPEKITVAAEKLETDSGGYLPRIVARAICLVAATQVEALGDTIRDKEKEVDGSSDSSTEGGDAGDGDGDAGAGPDSEAGDDTGAEAVADGEGADAAEA